MGMEGLQWRYTVDLNLTIVFLRSAFESHLLTLSIVSLWLSITCTDTFVETSPKTKNVISIRNSGGVWDLICPDATAYGKWMDAIALIFKELHVDPAKATKIIHIESENDEENSASTQSTASNSLTTSESASSRPSSSATSEISEPDSSTPQDASEAKKTMPLTSPRRPVLPDRPAMPTRPAPIAPHGHEHTSSNGSKPDIPSRPAKPDVPLRPEMPYRPTGSTTLRHAATTSSTTRPVGQSGPPVTSPPSTPRDDTSNSLSPRAASTSGTVTPVSPRMSPRPSMPTPPMPSLLSQSTPEKGESKFDSALQPNAVGGAAKGPSSVRIPLGGRGPSQSVGAASAPVASSVKIPSTFSKPQHSNSAPQKPIPPMPNLQQPTSASSSPDSANKLTIWMAGGLKHSSLYNPNFTTRSFLEKICKTRDAVTPDTFIAKTGSGQVIDIEVPLSSLGDVKEIYWDTLAPGKTMPPDFGVASALPPKLVGREPSKSVSSADKPTTNFGGSTSNFRISTDSKSSDTPVDTTPVDHRTKVAREIVATEQAYVESLGFLQTHFMNNLYAVVDGTAPSGGLNASGETSDVFRAAPKLSPLPPINDLRTMVPKTFEAILGFNEMFSKELRESGPEEVGKVFLKFLSFLKIYSDYASDYQTALNNYNRLTRESPSLAAKLEERKSNSPSKLRFEDYIIMPVQRVPRYLLLLGELIKHTANTHDDYQSLVTSERAISEIVTSINEAVRKSNGARRLRDLEEKGVNVDRLITPTRFLVREGAVKVTEGARGKIASLEGRKPITDSISKRDKKKETKHFFLFNDILVHVKDSQMIKGVDLSLPEYVWPLNLIWVEEEDSRAEIIGPNGQSMILKKKSKKGIMDSKKSSNSAAADSKKSGEVDSWIRDLSQRVLAYLQRNDPNLQSETTLPAARTGIYTTGPSSTGSEAEIYEGEWLSGLKHGQGKAACRSHNYEGLWESGKKNGKGTLTYANGWRYVGEWKNDLQHGAGSLYSGTSLTSPNGSSGMVGSSSVASVGGTGGLVGGSLTSSQRSSSDSAHQKATLDPNQKSPDRKHTSSSSNDTIPSTVSTPAPQSETALDVLFAGNWVNGVPHGHGTMIYYPSLDKYVGDFYEGRCTGQGVLTTASGVTYCGQWLEDHFDGRGEWSGPNGCTYTGQFRGGEKCGRGLMTYPDGSTYNGDWLNDVRHGRGEYKDLSDGTAYDGDWVDDRQEGKAVKTYPLSSAGINRPEINSSRNDSTPSKTDSPLSIGKSLSENSNAKLIKYEGTFTRGLRKGHGKLSYPDGSRYEGNWLDDEPNGNGIYVSSDGGSYQGEWLCGRREGKGTQIYANGAKYDGVWAADRFHKTGTFGAAPLDIFKSYDGEWVNGKMSGKGVLLFANGDGYRGTFKDGRLHGNGSWTWASGASFNGKWNLGLREGKGTYSSSGSPFAASASSSTNAGNQSFPASGALANPNFNSSSISLTAPSSSLMPNPLSLLGSSTTANSSEQISGNLEVASPNVLNTNGPLPFYLPPQQPIFFVPPAVDPLRLPRR